MGRNAFGIRGQDLDPRDDPVLRDGRIERLGEETPAHVDPVHGQRVDQVHRRRRAQGLVVLGSLAGLAQQALEDLDLVLDVDGAQGRRPVPGRRRRPRRALVVVVVDDREVVGAPLVQGDHPGSKRGFDANLQAGQGPGLGSLTDQVGGHERRLQHPVAELDDHPAAEAAPAGRPELESARGARAVLAAGRSSTPSAWLDRRDRR